MQTTLTGKPAPTTNVAQHAGEKRSAPANPKINAPKKKVVEQRIDTMLDKGINFKGHAPKNISEVYALGQALKLLNIGATRAISSQTTLEQYKSSVSCVWEWHEIAITAEGDDETSANRTAQWPQHQRWLPCIVTGIIT